MGKTYSVANRKGGCSKTTTVGALASGLNELGCKVLVIDMDPKEIFPIGLALTPMVKTLHTK